MSTGQQATRKKIYLAYYENKDWCGLLQILPKKFPLFWKAFLQKIASPVAAHLDQSRNKCGGEIAKLAVPVATRRQLRFQKKKFLVRCLSSGHHSDNHSKTCCMNEFLIQFSLSLSQIMTFT